MESVDCACSGETMTVNAHGALVRIAAPLLLGSEVTVRVPHTGKSASAAVVFAEPMQIGIELQKPENIWGVLVPPPDWNAPPSQTAFVS